MNNIKKSLILAALSLAATQSLAADDSEGAFRIGLGQSQTLGFDTDYEYTTFEIGYDIDRIFGLTADYSQADDDSIPNKLTAGFEAGYEFGDDFNIKPYVSAAFVHMRGNGAEGTTKGLIGLGVRASYKIFYINASFDYLPESNSSGPVDGGIYWNWKQHEFASLIVGLKF